MDDPKVKMTVGIKPSEAVAQLLQHSGFDNIEFKDGAWYKLELTLAFDKGIPKFFHRAILEEIQK